MGEGYYCDKLAGDRLRLCYDLAPPRVQRYLDAEIAFVLERIRPSHSVLELGCGYGRVLQRLFGKAQSIVGIDTSAESLRLARQLIGHDRCYRLYEMNAVALGFPDGQFDVVICIQNGIAAFGVGQRELVEEAVRVTRRRGTVLFSSYSQRFWTDRLEWFRIQSEHGLVGRIDEDATGDGVIACKDGFTAGALGPDEFLSLTSECGLAARITEVDGSSIFCEIPVP